MTRSEPRLLILSIRALLYLRPHILRWRLAVLCWRSAGGLTPFVEATLLGRRSLPRIVLGRVVLRLACRLLVAGERLAPEVVQG